MRMPWFFLWVALFTVFNTHAHAQRLRIVVGSPDFKPYPIAAPSIVSNGAEGATQSQRLTPVLQNALDSSRWFDLVPPNTYLSNPKDTWNAPYYNAWQQTGATGLVRGKIESVSQQMVFHLRFYDVTTQKELLTRRCTQTKESLHICIYDFLDELTALLTGEKGIFSSRLAYTKRSGKNRWVYQNTLDGTQEAAVSTLPTLHLIPSWDTQGRALFFTTYAQNNPDLYRYNIQTRQTEVFSKRTGLNMGAAVSPDGSQIALTLTMDGNPDIYTVDWNGKNLRKLTNSWANDLSPTWSPDGSRIAFVSSRSGNPHIYVMNADGSNPQPVTVKGKYNQEPDWSPIPNGPIVFTARDEQKRFDLFLVNPTTREITRLTQDNGDNENASFSPDGQLIVFTSTRGQGKNRKLYVMDNDGSRQHPIGDVTADYESPVWSRRLR
jgi:TolB protein